MHWAGFTAIGGVAATVTAMVVTAEEVHRYPVPVSIARERLATAPLPEPLAGIAGHKIILIREDGALVWNLGDAEHRSVARVTLEADGASTNVTVRFDLSDEAFGGGPIASATLTQSIAEELFREHVNSVLGGRPFDMQHMGLGMAREMQANPQMLEEYGEAVGQRLDSVSAIISEDDELDYVLAVPERGDGKAATRPNEDSYKPMINP